MNKRIIKLFILVIGIVSLFLYFSTLNKNKEDLVNYEDKEFIQKSIATEKYSDDCINYEDKEFFDNPIPIEWTARFDGCLSSCWGAYFTRFPEDSKYPKFSGYVPDDGERISDKFTKEGQLLKIYGNWTDVSDSYGSIFDNKCVPTVEIEKIELLFQK